MKKLLGIALSLCVVLTVLAGCGQRTEPQQAQTPPPAMSEPPAASEPATGALKTGMAIVTTRSAVDAGEDNGTSQVDSLAVGVIVDENGRIVDCSIDMAWNTMQFTPEGAVVMRSELPSKRELGDNYGMEAASSIGMEWYEQADALAQHIIGKNADELAGLVIGEDGKSTDVDLLSSATISIDVLQKAALNAIKNAG